MPDFDPNQVFQGANDPQNQHQPDQVGAINWQSLMQAQPQSRVVGHAATSTSGVSGGGDSGDSGLGGIIDGLKGLASKLGNDNTPGQGTALQRGLNNETQFQTGMPTTPYNSLPATAGFNTTLDNSKGMLGGQIPGNYGTGTYQGIIQNKLDPGSKLQNTPNAYPEQDLGQLYKTPAFQGALQAHTSAQNAGLTTSPLMTVVDFSKDAKQPRLWVVNTDKNQIMLNTQVAQGAVPGFSNNTDSHQSSLGTFRTGDEYYSQSMGKDAMKIEGLNPGLNDNAFSRGVVVHGGTYVGPDKSGTSWGCFAVPNDVAPSLIGLTKDGTIIHAYAPDQKALQTFGNNLTSQGQKNLQSSLPEAGDGPVANAISAAKQTYKDNPVMANIAASQAILESRLNGKPSQLATQSHNYFGIKGMGTAGSTVLPTHEFQNGQMTKTSAGFAKNNTDADSFAQHKQLMSNPRYAKVLQAKTPEEAAVELQRAGYATDPNYAKQLINIYHKYVQPKNGQSAADPQPRPGSPPVQNPAPYMPTYPNMPSYPTKQVAQNEGSGGLSAPGIDDEGENNGFVGHDPAAQLDYNNTNQNGNNGESSQELMPMPHGKFQNQMPSIDEPDGPYDTQETSNKQIDWQGIIQRLSQQA